MSTSHGWYAWYNRMPGADHKILRVSGFIVFPRGGYEVEVRDGDVGIIPEPGLFAIQITIAEPEAGPDVITTVPVYWQGEVEGVTTVRIQGLDPTRYITVDTVW